MKKYFYKFFVAPLFFIFLYLISLTLRIEIYNEDGTKYNKEVPLKDKNGKPIILLFWHGRMFIFPFVFRKVSSWYSILVSPSADGDIVANVLACFGYRCIRGSSYKEGIKAYYNLRKSLKEGYSIAIVADGSRGPLYKLQPGALHLAKSSGAAIVPVTFQAGSKKIFKSWDNFILPFPFSRVMIICGKEAYLSREISEIEFKEKQIELENLLNEITSRADNFF